MKLAKNKALEMKDIKGQYKIIDKKLYLDNLIVNSIKYKSLNENVIYESLISLKRAGSNAIVTYFALDIVKKLSKY